MSNNWLLHWHMLARTNRNRSSISFHDCDAVMRPKRVLQHCPPEINAKKSGGVT